MAKKTKTTKTVAPKPSTSVPVQFGARFNFHVTSPSGTSTGVSHWMRFTRPLSTKELKLLWDIEHALNALPTSTRVHIDLDELAVNR